MQVTVRTSDRLILQYGTNVGALGGCVVEDVTDATWAQIAALLPQAQGDGGVALSADHTSVTLQAPSAAWVAANQAIQAAVALRSQHQQALAQIKATLAGSTTTTANDIAAIETIIANLQAGTQPTQAQLLQILRFLLRALAVLNA